METTTTEKPKKGLSGFATFEFAISLMMLVALVAPFGIATMSFMGAENTKLFFYFSLIDDNSPITLYLPFVLPIINVIVKNYYRTSWLSLLTLHAAYIPIMAIDGTGSDIWVQVKPTFGYYLQWVNIFLMAGSVLISWIFFWGKKCTNYKRLFAISGIMIVGGIVVGIILIKLLDAAVLGAIFFSFNLLGIPLLIVAIISFFINHKKVEKIPELDENTGTQISSTSSSWFNKKTGMIIGGVLLIVLLVLGLFKCGGGDNDEPLLAECNIPQKDKNKLHSTDLDLFVLQGNVKTVVVKQLKDEFVSENWNIGFDKNGRLIKIGDYVISYSRSNLGKVTNQQGQLVKRDTSNRIESVFINAGCSGRQGFHFSYDVNGLSSYSEDTGECTGEEYYSNIEMEQGLIKGVICTMSDIGINTTSTIRYTYVKFDENGNWIERRVTESIVTEIEDEESDNSEPIVKTDKYVYDEVREIIYY